MENFNKTGKRITKVLEVFHWVGACLMAAAAVCALIAQSKIGYFANFDAKESCSASLEVYGFEVTAPVTNGSMDVTTFFLFGIGVCVILVLMAMVFRNLNLIFKSAENAALCRKETIRRLKEIGTFSIAVPAIGILMGAVIRLVVGGDAAEISVSENGIFMGIIVFCLTQLFVYGAENVSE